MTQIGARQPLSIQPTADFASTGAAVECPPGLGIALLDLRQPQKVQKPCTAVCSQDALIFEAIARETVNRLSTEPIDSTKEKSLLPL